MTLCEIFKHRAFSTWNLISKGRKIKDLYNNIDLIQNPSAYVQRMLDGLSIEAPDELVGRITIIREQA